MIVLSKSGKVRCQHQDDFKQTFGDRMFIDGVYDRVKRGVVSEEWYGLPPVLPLVAMYYHANQLHASLLSWNALCLSVAKGSLGFVDSSWIIPPSC